MSDEQILHHLKQLTTPQQTLDSQIFDCDTMKPQMRDALLSRVQWYIDNLFTPIAGLKIVDICLTGSATSYFYHQDSDIDLRIEVHNQNCPFVSSDPIMLDKFLNSLCNGFRRMGHQMKVGKRIVDIKASSRQIDVLGLYSIMDNKWRIYPDQHVCDNLDHNKILNRFNQRKHEIETTVKTLKQNYHGCTLAEQLEQFYIEQVIYDYTRFPQPNEDRIIEFIVQKLLLNQKIINQIGSESILQFNKALSLFP